MGRYCFIKLKQRVNLGNDRKKRLVVDGLTKDEANEYFDKQSVLDDAEGQALRQRIIDFDTTIVGTLRDYAQLCISTQGGASAKRAAVESFFKRRTTEARRAAAHVRAWRRDRVRIRRFRNAQVGEKATRRTDARGRCFRQWPGPSKRG